MFRTPLALFVNPVTERLLIKFERNGDEALEPSTMASNHNTDFPDGKFGEVMLFDCVDPKKANARMLLQNEE